MLILNIPNIMISFRTNGLLWYYKQNYLNLRKVHIVPTYKFIRLHYNIYINWGVTSKRNK